MRLRLVGIRNILNRGSINKEKKEVMGILLFSDE
jgi:hypothetical protein